MKLINETNCVVFMHDDDETNNFMSKTETSTSVQVNDNRVINYYLLCVYAALLMCVVLLLRTSRPIYNKQTTRQER